MNLLALSLSMTLLLNPTNIGIHLSKSGDYEAAEIVLKTVSERDRNATYYFFRTLDSYQLNHKQDVLSFADEVIYPNFMKVPEVVPTRYMTVAKLMKDDAERWKDDPEALDALSRDMKDVSKRLKVGKGGADTQKKENNILTKLDQHIKKLEDQEKKNESNGKPNINGETKKPAQDSQSQPIEQKPNVTGDIDRKKLAATAAEWGKLNEKQRADAMKELVNNLDPSTRDIIERYFNELSKRQEEP